MAGAPVKGVFVIEVSEYVDVIESVQDCGVGRLSYPVTAEEKPALQVWTADSGSSRHVTNMTIPMKVNTPFDYSYLGTAGSGDSILLLGIGDLQVAFVRIG